VSFQHGGVVFDLPATPDSIWGDDEQSLWAKGEGLMLYAATGIGKTTLAQRVILAGIGIGEPTVLGFTVHQITGNVLYIAADRPRQAMRSLRRMVTEQHRPVLDERLVWETRRRARITINNPESLLQLATEAGCEGGAIVIDSVKDIVPRISTDESGGAYNDAIQTCIVNGIDVLSLHHPRKATQERDRKALSLDDVYGSTWVTAGQGSVIALNGQAGTGTARFAHLKQPADEILGFDISFDYDLGTITTIGYRDIRGYLQSLEGTQASTAEICAFVHGGSDYTPTIKKRILRQLNRLAEQGEVAKTEQGKGTATLWNATNFTFVGMEPVRKRDRGGTQGWDTNRDKVGHGDVDPY